MAQPMKSSTPQFMVPTELTSWQIKRNTIRNELIKVLGDLPDRPKNTPARIISVSDKGNYLLEKFEFDNGTGAIVPGYLLLPKNGQNKFPAIYYCHWHGGNYDLGKEEIFQTHHTPDVPAETLVQQGYAVMAIDAYCFGERSGKGIGGADEKGSVEETTQSKYELWMGRSLWGMMLRDDLMAIEYFLSRKEIDITKLAVTGISMGATRSWWLMAIDERIKTGVAVGCLTRYQNLIAEQKLKYHGIYYFVPGILKYFDTEAIVSLIAPRPILFMTGDEDPGSPVAGIRKIENDVQQVYKLFNAQNNFESIIYPKTGHTYTPDMWNRMLKWMEVQLKK